jgi:hypothetical protein
MNEAEEQHEQQEEQQEQQEEGDMRLNGLRAIINTTNHKHPQLHKRRCNLNQEPNGPVATHEASCLEREEHNGVRVLHGNSRSLSISLNISNRPIHAFIRRRDVQIHDRTKQHITKRKRTNMPNPETPLYADRQHVVQHSPVAHQRYRTTTAQRNKVNRLIVWTLVLLV